VVNIPDALLKRLCGSENKKPRRLPPLKHVFLGPNNEYYVLFRNGTSAWNAGSSGHAVSSLIKNTDADVSVLTFAPYGGFFVLFDNGSSECANLPPRLHSFLSDNKPRLSNIANISASEAGWFVAFNDDKYPSWKCDLDDDIAGSATLRSKINTLIEKGSKIRSVDFGSPGNWLLRHDVKT